HHNSATTLRLVSNRIFCLLTDIALPFCCYTENPPKGRNGSANTTEKRSGLRPCRDPVNQLYTGFPSAA
ncbi:MAG: hypothetical protein ABGX68_04145, partial [Methylococcales bacterium]